MVIAISFGTTKMPEMRAVVHQPILAEQMARLIMEGDSSIRALLLIDGGGRIVAHATAELFDDEETKPGDDFPMLIQFPNHDVSVFIRLGLSAKPESVKAKILGFFGDPQ